MTSNANTSGLGDVGLSETYRFAYESIRNGAPGLSDAACAAIARSINMKVSLAANVTADKITELEAEIAELIAERSRRSVAWQRSEARADRLAKALVMIGGEKPERKRSYQNNYRGGFDAATDLAVSIARAALQQETQP